MRARSIKPSFYKNSDLSECSVWARLLAPALWMLADREGRLEDRPKQIKGEAFPYDNVEIEPLLIELEKANHLIRYTVDKRSYIEIINFTKHQYPHHKEKQSVIPQKASGKTRARTNLGKCQPPLNPDILNPDILKASEREFFDLYFWKPYPKQRAGDSDKAFSAWLVALRKATDKEILDGLAAYILSDEVAKGFAKGAAAWLNDSRWTSNYSKPVASKPQKANVRTLGGRNEQ